jgi:pimeloyl-ACP methyl ester carboxylesterase
VLALLREQRMFPHMLVGHSFGGKVVMSMAQQFGAQLPRPVQVCAVMARQQLTWSVVAVVGLQRQGYFWRFGSVSEHSQVIEGQRHQP